MKFELVAQYLEKIDSKSSRLEMNSLFVEFLNEIKSESKSDIQKSIYMMLGTLAPEYVSLKFNVSEKTIEKILIDIFGQEIFQSSYSRKGDLGAVFYENASAKGKDLSVSSVYAALLSVCSASGTGAVAKKMAIIKELLSSLSAVEGKYAIRVILEDLRVGFNDKTFIESISLFLTGDKSAAKTVERAYGLQADMGSLVNIAISSGLEGVRSLTAKPGIPIKVKLVQREDGFEEILERFSPVALQPKYDGIRCQIHISKSFSEEVFKVVWHLDGETADNTQKGLFEEEDSSESSISKKVKLFTRNQEDITEMFPDLILELSKFAEKYDDIIIDSEIISKDPSGRFQAFQETMKRKRKYDIGLKSQEIPVEVYAFDILYIDGVDLTEKSFQDRYEELEKVYQTGKNIGISKLNLTENDIVEDVETAEKVFESQIKKGLEGVIAKDPNSYYKVGTRNYDWIKIKRASRSDLADTIDGVVLGYYVGKGKRTKFGLGALLIGLYNKKDDSFYTIGKVGTGVTDEQFKTIFERLKNIQLDKKPSNYMVNKPLEADVYVKPEVVCVIEADEITQSPVHTSGYALRFPRLKEFERIDKTYAETTSIEEVQKIHQIFLNMLKGA